MFVQQAQVGLSTIILLQVLQNTKAEVSETCYPKFQLISGHSACVPKSSQAFAGGVTEIDKIEIVDRHNYHRANVDPPAANMLKMSWDDELALVAQAWADNCYFAHDTYYARVIPGRYNAGQNLAAYNVWNWTHIIDYWHDEVYNFVFGVGSEDGGSVGHYTQMVWAKSHKIGCGYAVCIILGGLGAFSGFFVCNYSPAGNVVPVQYIPYVIGDSCDQCPDTCDNNLCDCTAYDCYNYGTMDVNTCSCTCYNLASYYVGSKCVLNCADIGNPTCSFTEDQCTAFGNVPFDCPVLCGFCPGGDSTYLLSDGGAGGDGNGGDGGDSGLPLGFTCYPNGTIKVINPDAATYTDVVAVQYEGSSSAAKCSVAASGDEIMLTECAEDSNIALFFSNRTNVHNGVFSGQAIISFTIGCKEIASAGISRSVTEQLDITLPATDADDITPSFSVTSKLRTDSATGTPTSSAKVGDTLYWTIDIPSEYKGRPTCTAYSGTSSSGSINKAIVTNGCTTDSSLVGDHFDNELTSIPHIKRIWTQLYVFRFYQSNDLYIDCIVKVCTSASSGCDLSCSNKKRSVDGQTDEETDMIFRTSSLLHVSNDGNCASVIPAQACGDSLSTCKLKQF